MGAVGKSGMRNRLSVLRAEHDDMTQQQLADAMKVSRGTINAIEKNKYLPTLKLAFRLAKYFEVSIEDIFKDE